MGRRTFLQRVLLVLAAIPGLASLAKLAPATEPTATTLLPSDRKAVEAAEEPATRVKISMWQESDVRGDEEPLYEPILRAERKFACHRDSVDDIFDWCRMISQSQTMPTGSRWLCRMDHIS